MKSLEERKAFRKKQREGEEKAREEGGLPKEQQQQEGGGTVASNEADVESEEEEEVEPMTAQQADEWVDDTVDNIKENLDTLNDDDLTAIEEAEKRRNEKKRVGVLDAIAKERDARKAKGENWNAGK